MARLTPKDWLELEYKMRLQIARIITPARQTVHASWFGVGHRLKENNDNGEDQFKSKVYYTSKLSKPSQHTFLSGS